MDEFSVCSLQEAAASADEPRCVVRLKTSAWSDGRGVHIKKSLIFLRRECRGYNLLEDEISNIGAGELEGRIINLYQVQDGVYEVVSVNISRDYESGQIDDWDLKLISFNGGNG